MENVSNQIMVNVKQEVTFLHREVNFGDTKHSMCVSVSAYFLSISRMHVASLLTLFYPGSGKTLLPRGGGIMAPLFFWLWGYLKPKTEPWHIFGTKNYLKSHIEHFQVPQFSRQRARNFNRYYSRKIQNFQNFEFQGCYAPQMKAENMYNSN